MYKNLRPVTSVIKKHKLTLFCLLLLFISRIFFVNTKGVFFDSKEYFNLLSNPNYLRAIAIGHFPPHEGYIILFWPIFQIVHYFQGNGAYAVILGQIILSFVTLYCFNKVIEYISDKQTALYATLFAALIPLFWIVNVTLMMENAYAAFFFISLFLLTKYLKANKKTILLHLSLFLYGLAIITQTFVVLWAPLYLSIIFLKKKQLLKKTFIYLLIYFAAFSLINILFISSIDNIQPQIAFSDLYLNKSGEFATLHFDLKSVAIAGRNFLIPLLRNNSILLILLSSLSLIILVKKNIKLFFFGIVWILPALYANQWWDSLLNGRHALLSGFGIAFLSAYLLKSKKILCILVIVYLLIVSLPALNLLRYPIPYLQEAQYVATLPKNALLLESHFARPQVQDTTRSKTIYVNEPYWPQDTIAHEINTYLAQRKPVFVSSAALSEPYGLYSGPYLHNITLSYAQPFTLQTLLSGYTFKLYKTISTKDNLIIYQIISNKKGSYPSIKHLQYSYRRIDYTDPFSWSIRFFEATLSNN